MRAYINLFFRFVSDSPTNPHLTLCSRSFIPTVSCLWLPVHFFSMLVFVSLRLQYMPPTCFVYLFSFIPIFLCFPVPPQLYRITFALITSSHLQSIRNSLHFHCFYCSQMHWGHPMEVDQVREMLHSMRWCFALFTLTQIYSILFWFDALYRVGKGKKMSPTCFLCLQYCQWFRWGFVCLPEPTHCPVHEETEGHQQISNEKVSIITLIKQWVHTKYIPERKFTAFSQVI